MKLERYFAQGGGNVALPTLNNSIAFFTEFGRRCALRDAVYTTRMVGVKDEFYQLDFTLPPTVPKVLQLCIDRGPRARYAKLFRRYHVEAPDGEVYRKLQEQSRFHSSARASSTTPSAAAAAAAPALTAALAVAAARTVRVSP